MRTYVPAPLALEVLNNPWLSGAPGIAELVKRRLHSLLAVLHIVARHSSATVAVVHDVMCTLEDGPDSVGHRPLACLMVQSLADALVPRGGDMVGAQVNGHALPKHCPARH